MSGSRRRSAPLSQIKSKATYAGSRAFRRKIIELWSASFVGCDDLSVENCFVHIKRSCNLLAETGEPAHQVAVARNEAAVTLLVIAEGPEAVVFDIKEPPRIVEWLLRRDGRNGLDARKHWGAGGHLAQAADAAHRLNARRSGISVTAPTSYPPPPTSASGGPQRTTCGPLPSGLVTNVEVPGTLPTGVSHDASTPPAAVSKVHSANRRHKTDQSTSVRSAMQQQPEDEQGSPEVDHPRQNGQLRVEPSKASPESFIAVVLA